ncbi:MAG: CBS domain-containing protein [Oscillospiraceae bacterium]|nr:CBS domain-containing protein [Oscillospiraceae bacterium]
MNIQSIMTENVRSIHPDEPITAAARLLKRDNIGCLPVCDDSGHVAGMVTDRDIALRCVAAGLDPSQTTVSQIMTAGVYTLSPTDSVDAAAETMRKAQVRRIPVTDKGRLCGIVSLGDLTARCKCGRETMQTITDLSSCVCNRSK